jgi:hypothetical protein
MAYEKLGDKDNHEEALRRSSILAKIRVNLGSVQSDAEAACLDLATQCRAIEMEAAAKVFEKHAARIKSQTKNRSTRNAMTNPQALCSSAHAPYSPTRDSRTS